MLVCFEDATESTCGLPSVGPKRRSRFTSALASTCSASIHPSHPAPNSSVNSTSHSSKGIYLQRPFPSSVRGDWQYPNLPGAYSRRLVARECNLRRVDYDGSLDRFFSP